MPIVTKAFRPGCLIVFSILMAACDHGVTRQTQAVIFSVDGTASLTHARNGRTEPIQVHSHLSVGDLVKTNIGGKLRLQIVPGILSEIQADSELEIEALQVTKDGNVMKNAMLQRKARLQFTRGVIDAVVEKKDEAGATLVLETPFGAVTAPGECVFRCVVNDRGGRVVCIRGALQVQRNRARSDSVAAGSYCDLGPNSGEVKRADQDGDAQSDVVATLESMSELLALQTREILRPKPWRHCQEKP